MLKFYLVISIFLLLPDAANAQKDNGIFFNHDLHPIAIDTINEYILVVHKRYATLYFKQSDIQENCRLQNKSVLSNDQSFPITTALLQTKKKRIELNDWINEYSDEEKKLNFKFRIIQGVDQMAMPEMWYIGAGLIRECKFMIVDNNTRKIAYNGLEMITKNEEWGTRIIQYKLSSGFYFWQTINMIGS